MERGEKLKGTSTQMSIDRPLFRSYARMPPPKPLEHTFRQYKCLWLLVVVAGLSFGFTLAYATALSSSTGKLNETITSALPPSVALSVLRIISEVTSVLFSIMIASTIDAILWTAACRK